MSERLPERVNPFRLAAREARLTGRMPLAAMARLKVEGGEVLVQLAFSERAGGMAFLDVSIQGEAQVQCQLCMEAMRICLDSHSSLRVISAEAAARGAGGEDELLVIEDDSLLIADLIEDEIVLALPLAPMHESPQLCAGKVIREFSREEAEDARRAGNNPFAVLKNLKPN